MSDETFDGLTLEQWYEQTLTNPVGRALLTLFRKALAPEAAPCIVSADGKITPLPDGLVVLIDGVPHRLVRCPECEGWPTSPGEDPCERCINDLGVVAVPYEGDD